MRKALVAGILLFLVLLVFRAPAGIVPLLIDRSAPISLLAANGTIWNGGAELLVDGTSLGRLSWRFSPAVLLDGRVGYDLALDGQHIAVSGPLSAATDSVSSALNGTVEAPLVNNWLTIYDIELSGTFQLDGLSITLADGRITAANGSLDWGGGPVTYALAGRVNRVSLPALAGELGPGPEAVVLAAGNRTPLLHAELQPNGYVKLGVTKYLTKLVGDPYPGSDPDHAVVLEVEERVF